MSHSKTPVLNGAGEIVFRADSGEIERMIALRQAVYTHDRRCVRLTALTREREHPGRTRTSRGGLLAAIGRSQQYTTTNGRGQVDGFKRIFAEDLSIFLSAVLDNRRVGTAPVRVFVARSGYAAGQAAELDAIARRAGVVFVVGMKPAAVVA